MYYLILIMLVVIIALLVILLRKAKRIDTNTWEMREWIQGRLENEFRQVEALLALTRELKLENGLQPMRRWAGSPDFLLVLLRKVIADKPQVIVECSSGISTIVSARALQLNGTGHVYSLEHEQEYAQKTRDELARHGLQDWATVIDAPLIETDTRLGKKRWYDISRLPTDKIDLVVVDGPPESTNPLARYQAGPALIPRLSATGEVVMDDMIRKTEQNVVAAWQHEFPGLQVTHIPAEKEIAVVSRSS